jgi:hypothetical protein
MGNRIATRRYNRQKEQDLGPAVEPVEAAPPLQEGLHEACSPHFAVVIEYKDQEQMTELCLRQDILTKLAVEAEFRDMRIGELVGAFICINRNSI